jgi:hypothetical protein
VFIVSCNHFPKRSPALRTVSRVSEEIYPS